MMCVQSWNGLSDGWGNNNFTRQIISQTRQFYTGCMVGWENKFSNGHVSNTFLLSSSLGCGQFVTKLELERNDKIQSRIILSAECNFFYLRRKIEKVRKKKVWIENILFGHVVYKKKMAVSTPAAHVLLQNLTQTCQLPSIFI
jgi:hypothetical protein